MKRMLSYGAVAFACCLLLAQPARAAFDTQANIKATDSVHFAFAPNRAGNGGPFLGTVNGDTWVTYCVEGADSSQTINIPGTYTVQSISSNIATTTNNYVTEAAKYLYYAAGHGLLGGIYNPTVTANNTALQNAIWSLVVEGGKTPWNNSYVITSNSNQFLLNSVSGDAAAYRLAAVTAVTGVGQAQALALAARIAIVNPVYANNTPAQSMLVEVPEPASLVVWSVLAGGAAGLTVARRKRRNAPAGRWSDESRSAIFAVVDKCEQH